MRWSNLGPQAKEQKKQERLAFASFLAEVARRPSFGEFFSPWDLLWFGLAAVTAFKIDVGTYGGD